MAPSDPTPRLGDLLRAVRRDNGLTLEEVSERAGVAVRTLGDLERHRIARPHRRTIEALVGSLRVDDARLAAIWAAARPAPATARADQPDTHTIGREAETADLNRWYEGWRTDQVSPGPVIVSGLPGIGKTTFSYAFCHAHPDDFPDGRFSLNLGGSQEAPLEPIVALGRLLENIGVPPERIPESAERRGALFRRRLHDLRMLIGLADARDENQVRLLLPESTRSMMMITSRRTLAGLPAGKRIVLREPSPADAWALLEAMVGRERVAAEQASAAELARLCGYLPLALGMVATRLATRPGATIADQVDRLSLPDDRLARLTAGDRSVRGVFERHYRRLTVDQQRTFRRLCVVRGPELSVSTVARTLGLDADTAEDGLDGLVDAGMLTAATDGRYQVNSLIRQFGREMLAAEESAATVESLLTAQGPPIALAGSRECLGTSRAA